MKALLKFPLYAATIAMMTAGMASCDDDDENGNGGDGTQSPTEIREAALQQVINEYVDNTVIPTYTALADASVELHTACMEMYNAGVGNVTEAQVWAAGEAWKDAREYWERSEAWLYGPAATYDVDPHIDSWPLDQNALDALLANATEMAKMDAEGVYISSQEYGLLGFHALEYMLFAIEGTGMGQTSVPHATDYTAEELSYIAGVAGDLRNHCIFLEAAWVGESNINATKKSVLNEVRSIAEFADNNVSIENVLNDLANGLCYADQMKNPAEAGGNVFVNYLEATQTMIADGIQNIANEVGNVKIGNPTGMGTGDDYEYDPNYIESPYSLNSIHDFLGNIISIENAYMGIQSSKTYNQGLGNYANTVAYSLSSYVAELDADLDSRVKSAITNAYDAVSQMQEPFVVTCASADYATVNRAAVTACNELNDIFDEVAALLNNQR